MADETNNNENNDEANGAEEIDAPGDAAPADEVDPELMRIPRRRRRRHPVIALVVIALGLYVMWFLREDFLYFFQPREPVDLGEVSQLAQKGIKLRHNSHVTLQGAPDRKNALILESRSGYESFFRLLQSDSLVFVQRHRALRSSDQEISSTHTGRLVRFDSLPYADNMRAYFGKNMTLAHDLPYAAVAHARRAGQDSATLRDVAGRSVRLGRDSLIWINVAHPNEWVVQFRKQFYPKVELAETKVRELNLPFAQDKEPSTMFWRFVVHAAPDDLPVLMARFRDQSLNVGVVRRQLSYSARWNQIGVYAGGLAINAADPTFPTLFREAEPAGEGQPNRLVPVEERTVRIPKDTILYIETSSPLAVEPNAMVLLTGEAPADNWFYLLLYAVLGVFVLLNLVSLGLRLRDRPARGGSQ